MIIAKSATPEVLPYLGTLALLPAIGLFYIFLTGSRETGFEIFGARTV
jgi:hypothetical protein